MRGSGALSPNSIVRVPVCLGRVPEGLSPNSSVGVVVFCWGVFMATTILDTNMRLTISMPRSS